jgi:aubergine-like protein
MEKYPDVSDVVVSKKVKRPALSANYRSFTSVDVVSNHYNFKLGVGGSIFQWDVQFEPELEKDSREVKNDIFGACRKDIIAKVGSFIRTGDIVFTFRLSAKKEEIIYFDIHPKYKIKLIYTKKTLDFRDIDADDNMKVQIYKVINSGLKTCMRNLGFTEFGFSRKFYDLQKKQEISINRGEWLLDIKSGYMASVDLYANKTPKVLIDCSSRIIRVYTMLDEFDFFKNERGMQEDEIFDTFVIGRMFLAAYGNNRVYRVEGVERGKTPESEFPNLSKAKTYTEYYKKQYGIKINNLKQFLVYSIKINKSMDKDGNLVETEEKIYLIPELLKPTGLTDELRNDRNAMQEVANYTKLSPSYRNERQGALIKQINDIKSDDKNPVGIKIDLSSSKIKGKMLNFPTITMRKPFVPKQANFIIKDPIFESGAKIQDWILICDARDSDFAKDFALNIKKAASSLAIEVGKPLICALYTEKGGKFIRDDQIMKIIESNPTAKIALVFLQKFNADKVYKKVKAHCNQKLGMPTQFFSNWKPNFTKNLENLSVATKVAIQMAAKMKFKIWKVQLPTHVNENGHQVMIVGADVFHRSFKESVTSVVSTYDRDLSSYYSQTSVQKRKGDDCLYDIADKVRLAARRYVKENNVPPNIIVVYRDGVGEGQIDGVREKEVKSLLKGLKEEFNGKNVRLAYIIVTKRISDRFFTEDQYKKRLDNPIGGLIIDSDVTKDDRFDYFMVAQQVTQGTATPTYYNAIYNDTDLKAESFYEMTYFQCFSYSNWSGALKVPAVIQMANKQGLTVGNTHSRDGKETHDKLKDTPYYF